MNTYGTLAPDSVTYVVFMDDGTEWVVSTHRGWKRAIELAESFSGRKGMGTTIKS